MIVSDVDNPWILVLSHANDYFSLFDFILFGHYFSQFDFRVTCLCTEITLYIFRFASSFANITVIVESGNSTNEISECSLQHT